MPRPSVTGVQGLYAFEVEKDASFPKGRRYRIDLRYTGADGKPARYKEIQPAGMTADEFKQHAKDILAQSRTSIVGATPQAVDDAPIKLSQAFDQYLQWVQTNRPKAHHDRKGIKSVWVKTVGDVPIERLTPELVETYKTKRREGGTAPATINRGVAMVKHMCSLAARSGWPWMSRERAMVIGEVGMLKEPPGRQRPIKPKELQAILKAFSFRESRFARRVFCASLLTGCRAGELLNLRESNVDLKKRLIDLSETKQNRNHQVVINDALAALIKEALADRGNHKGGYVFVNARGKPYTSRGFSHQFADVTERAGVPDITFHDLRRHVGTVLINSGERLEVVSKLLGHSNVAVTQRSYAHLATEATRAAFQKIASVLPSIGG